VAASELTHRERVRLALEHERTDRVPIALVCSGINQPARDRLNELLIRTRGLTVEQYLRPLIDVRDVAPGYVGPPLPERTDAWGVRRVPVSYGPASYDEIEHYPLAEAEDEADVAAHRFPSPDWFDYDALPDRIAAVQADGGPYCLMVGNGNIFETSWYMRGFERIFMDLALRPELAHAIFERVCSFYEEFFRRVLTAADGEVDLIFTADDIGGQQGLLMSLQMWAENLKPYHARVNRVVHEFGARVIYHTDGAVMEAVPGLIEMGVDVLQALQFDAAGMDPVRLKEDYGERLCFEGGVSVQQTLPFGRPDDVRREVRQRIDVLGRGGGYVCGPSHAIQAGTPPENILALFDTAAAHPVT
jgi:uroporphyrinogen decarboxylase